jgi:hypothetical protein
MGAEIRIDSGGVTVSPSESERIAALERRQTAHTFGLVALGVLGAGGLAFLALWTKTNAQRDAENIAHDLTALRLAVQDVPGVQERFARLYVRPPQYLTADPILRNAWQSQSGPLARLLGR